MILPTLLDVLCGLLLVNPLVRKAHGHMLQSLNPNGIRDLPTTPSNGSQVKPVKDPTHQHPQLLSPQLIEIQFAVDAAMHSGASSLFRRDATLCLPDGTCADGR